MQIVKHRINTVEDLKNVPISYGIEIDIRYHKNELVLHHDPFSHHLTHPEKFEKLLSHWRHAGPMILNIKTEGVELRCIELMNRYNVQNWFFLDLSMPYFTIYAEKAWNREIPGFSADNLAVRFSEREALEYALGFSGKAKWVWVDCFTKLPLTKEVSKSLEVSGFQICLVSPELQKHDPEMIYAFRESLKGINVSAVCTKFPEKWKSPMEAKLS